MKYRKFDSDRSIRYTRRSLRLPKHTYTWGAYFVTIRAEVPEPLFEIPELCAILVETWEALPQRFAGLTLDEFVVMPDHVHFIVQLDDNIEKPPTLADVVGAYKSLTTVAWLRHIKTMKLERSGRLWQDNYFERVIRDAPELENTRQYIRNNPNKLRKSPPDEQEQV